MASAIANDAGRTGNRVPWSLPPYKRHSPLLKMLGHVAPRWRVGSALSPTRQPNSTNLTSRTASECSSLRRKPSVRNSKLDCSSKSHRRSIAYRYFSLTSAASAKSQKNVVEEQSEPFEVEPQHLPQEPTVLPLHCVFKVLAVETPPNYFVPVRTVLCCSTYVPVRVFPSVASSDLLFPPF